MITTPLSKKIAATEAKKNFYRMINEVAKQQTLFLVSRKGQPCVVVLGVDQYQELIEELETGQELHDSGYLAALAEVREGISLVIP